jgi:Collagen triple helix repeat (20 copies)
MPDPDFINVTINDDDQPINVTFNVTDSDVPGPTGPTGAAGAAGSTGPTGSAGSVGSAGATGATGPAGAAGAPGAAGAAGTAGAAGAAGVRGSKFQGTFSSSSALPTINGTTVLQSDFAYVGSNLEVWIAGASTWSDTGVFAQGATGPTGTTGAAGGVGPTGPAGSAGAAGAAGSTGTAGVRGSKYQGTFTLSSSLPTIDGTTVLQSDFAYVGVNSELWIAGASTWSDSGVSVQGVAGAAGSAGATGGTGPTGPQGIQGITGTTGSAGAAGSTGAAGAAGAAGSGSQTRNLLINGNFETVPYQWYKNNVAVNNWVADMWYLGGQSTALLQFAGHYGAVLQGSNPQSKNSTWLVPQTAQASLAATDWVSLLTWIEGYTYAPASDASMVIECWIIPTVAGVYSISVRNGAKTQSFIHAVTFTSGQLNAPQHVSFTLPAPSSTSGFTYTNNVGLIIGLSMGAGSSMVTSTLDTWVSGNFVAATGQVNLVGTSVYTNFGQFGAYAGAAPTTYLYAPWKDFELRLQRYLAHTGPRSGIGGSGANVNITDFTSFLASLPTSSAGPCFAYPFNSFLTIATVTGGQFAVDLMNATPTATIGAGVAGTVFDMGINSGSPAGCTIDTGTFTTRGIGRINTSGTFTAGHLYSFHYFMDCRPSIA